tara:strand:- start:789 stop:1601 length:813 start_codon:yes stop_codon:yes gene_type:complete
MDYNIYKKLSIEEKNKAFEKWESDNFIFKPFSKILLKKILELKPEFSNILLISSDLNETIEEISKIKCKNLIYLSQYEIFKKEFFKNKSYSLIFADFEDLPFKKKSFDLIISNFCTNKVFDKKNYLKRIFDILTEDGLFLCNFFGEQTLKELRECFFIADDKFLNGAFNRIPQVDLMADFSNLLSTIGYNEIVTEKINFDIFYKNIINILKDIKSMGEKIPIKDKREKVSKSYLKFLNKIYKKEFADQSSQLKATLDIISISSWKQLKNN